jgi:uncharacterized membrane protein (UPF0127 family)
MRQIAVVNTTTGETLATHAAVADTLWTRFLGLQGRRTLPSGAGLVLLPTNSIHMLFMFLRIDAVFVSRDGHVVRIGRRLRPWTLGPIARDALYCVELPERAAEHTQVGHAIELRALPAA